MKHTDYENPARITITKHYSGTDDFEYYTLEYLNEGEEWTLDAPKEEILAELSEHLENMKGGKGE